MHSAVLDLVEATPTAELPALIGQLATAQALALQRLAAPPPVVDQARLVDAAEMAGILGTPTNWVSDAGRAGRIPVVRLGHYVRFNPAEVLEAVRKLPPSHDRAFCGVKTTQERRGGNRRVSTDCPTSEANSGGPTP